MCMVFFAMAGVAHAESFGNEIFDRLAKQLCLRVTKQPRCSRIRITDQPFGIRDKNRVRRNFEKVLERSVSELGPC